MIGVRDAAFAAALSGVVALGSGCAPGNPSPAITGPTSTATSIPIQPADVDPVFTDPDAGAQFRELTATEVREDRGPLLRVVEGQLKSGDGQAFVDQYLSGMSNQVAQANPPKTVATDPMAIGEYSVTYFNVPVAAQGYVYADGPTAVIAYDVAEPSRSDAAQDALLEILTAVQP